MHPSLMRVLALFLILTGLLSAQRVLYNGDLDKKGQNAAAAAEQIASDSVTSKEIQNLAQIEKDQVNGALDAGLIVARRYVEALSTWADLQASVNQIGGDALNDPLCEAIGLDDQSIEAQKKQLTDKLAALKTASKQNPPSLDSVIKEIGDLKDVTDFASGLSKNTPLAAVTADASLALKRVIGGLQELNQLIATATTIWQTQEDVSVDVRSLAPTKEETQIVMLAEDTRYLKELTLIRARRTLDDQAFARTVADILPLMDNLVSQQKLDLNADIREDVARLAREVKATQTSNPAAAVQLDDALRTRLQILHSATSLFAQNNVGSNVALLRETIAWRRHQVRVHEIYNGAYEGTLKIATQRLASYYAAGLKPSQIAQLLHDLAVSVSLPKIAF